MPDGKLPELSVLNLEMPEKFQKIAELGFQKVGQWMLDGETLNFSINREAREEKNVLYAFVSNGALVYVGKTTQALKDRLQRYKTPAKNSLKGGSTNIKNHKNLKTQLVEGEVVEIYMFLPKESSTLGGFSINIAAALEDSLISELKPPWNGRSVAASTLTSIDLSLVKSPPIKKVSDRFSVADFRALLRQKINEAEILGLIHIDIVSGALHRQIGGYPGRNHAMPVCCSVMRGEMRSGDEVLAAPPKGRGASLCIRYLLPR